jgi:uncharacterized protein
MTEATLIQTPFKSDIPFPRDWPVARYFALLRERLPELRQRYGVTYLGVFGSYVRNEQEPDSDLDVLFEYDYPHMTLFTYVGIENELSDYLGVKVDLVHKKGLKPAIGRYILREVVEVCEANAT